MNENMKDGAAARVTARRRLIRGAFGAPAALTLFSGNVFAAASSSLRALENELSAGGRFPQLDPDDTWIRVKIYLGDGKVTATGAELTQALIVSGSEVVGEPGCGIDPKFIVQGGWATVDESAPFTLIESSLKDPDPKRWAALRFDSSGFIVGVSTGAKVSGQTALTRSAGTSLCPTATRTNAYRVDGFGID